MFLVKALGCFEYYDSLMVHLLNLFFPHERLYLNTFYSAESLIHFPSPFRNSLMSVLMIAVIDSESLYNLMYGVEECAPTDQLGKQIF